MKKCIESLVVWIPCKVSIYFSMFCCMFIDFWLYCKWNDLKIQSHTVYSYFLSLFVFRSTMFGLQTPGYLTDNSKKKWGKISLWKHLMASWIFQPWCRSILYEYRMKVLHNDCYGPTQKDYLSLLFLCFWWKKICNGYNMQWIFNQVCSR